MAYTFRAEQRFCRPLDEVFAFFSQAQNLEVITPPWLRFSIVTPAPIEMREGTLIDYKLRVHGVPLRWRSRISVWEPPYRFVDEQVKGPYRMWHHLHTFCADGDATIVGDTVTWAVWGGPLARPLVERDIHAIFNYRKRRLEELFGSERAA